MTSPRIALIHATPVAIEPIRDALSSGWPEADVVNILEDSLSPDRASSKELTPELCELKIPLISDEAINIGKSWLFEEELTELFHERPQAILPHGRDELIMQAALAEQRMDTSLGCAGL